MTLDGRNRRRIVCFKKQVDFGDLFFRKINLSENWEGKVIRPITRLDFCRTNLNDDMATYSAKI